MFVVTDFVGAATGGTSTHGLTDRTDGLLFLGCDGDGAAFRRSKMIFETRRVFEVALAIVASNPCFQLTFLPAGVEAAFANVFAAVVDVVVIPLLATVAVVCFFYQGRK